MNPAEKWIADFQFRRKQTLTASAKNLGAVSQMGMPDFLAVRLLGSATRHLTMAVLGVVLISISR